MSTWFLDFETRSGADIKTVGHWRYIQDREAAPLLIALAKDNDEPRIVRANDPLFHEMLADDGPIVAHNAAFEMAVMTACFPLQPELKRWRCTQTMARMAGLPDSLAKVTATLFDGEDKRKDRRGKLLIRKFCCPPFAKPEDHPKDWDDFRAYALQDVRATQAVYHELRAFQLDRHPTVLRTFLADLQVNAIGLPVHLLAAKRAAKILDSELAAAQQTFAHLTDGLGPDQYVELKKWLVRQGYPQAESLTKDVIESVVARADAGEIKLTPQGRQVLALRARLNHAAAKKAYAIVRSAGPDARVRGCFQFYGASNTGRWAGRLIQPQNMRRNSKESAKTFRLLSGERAPTAEELGTIMKMSPVEAVADSCRHLICAPPGRALIQCDYANIESRILFWLAGCEHALQAYRDGKDLYEMMAERIGKGATRQLGKQAVLGCGYGMGPARFQDTCAKYGIEVSAALAERAVDSYRDAFEEVPELWKRLGNAAKAVVNMRIREWKTLGKLRLRYATLTSKHIPYLLIQLPSGRILTYPYPKLVRGKFGSELRYWGKVQGKAGFMSVKLYGGKLVENVVQAIAGDLLYEAVGLLTFDRDEEMGDALLVGYVHDELLVEVAESAVTEEVNAVEEAMLATPAWAEGLPVEVESTVGKFYTKA